MDAWMATRHGVGAAVCHHVLPAIASWAATPASIGRLQLLQCVLCCIWGNQQVELL
eukprot:gene5960-9108_t